MRWVVAELKNKNVNPINGAYLGPSFHSQEWQCAMADRRNDEGAASFYMIYLEYDWWAFEVIDRELILWRLRRRRRRPGHGLGWAGGGAKRADETFAGPPIQLKNTYEHIGTIGLSIPQYKCVSWCQEFPGIAEMTPTIPEIRAKNLDPNPSRKDRVVVEHYHSIQSLHQRCG